MIGQAVSSGGRFMSPDWSAQVEPVPYAKLGDPQSLNLYAYVLNNPEPSRDSDGHVVSLAQYHASLGFIGHPDQLGADEAVASEMSYEYWALAQQQQVQKENNDCHCGTNRRFRSNDKAAIAALDAIFPQSEREDYEYAGRIYRNADGTYSYTTPTTEKNSHESDPDNGGAEGSRIPAGTSNAGIYHTHPKTPGYASEQFSGGDGALAVREHVPNYMEAPSRTIYKIDGTHSNDYLTAPQSIVRPGSPVQ